MEDEDEDEDEEEEDEDEDEEEEEAEQEEDHTGRRNDPRRELGDTSLVKKVLEQEPEMLPCHASASPLSPQLSSFGTPRLGPSIKVWDPYNVLAPPPPPPPPLPFSRSFSSDVLLNDARTITEVFLISHGDWHMNLRPDLIAGRCPDAALTPNGKRQARALAVFLKSQGVRFNAVYTSPLDRARATAVSVCLRARRRRGRLNRCLLGMTGRKKICLEICFEPSTTSCGLSFCEKCLRSVAEKCGRRCPRCRQLISNGRCCTVNTALWNTVQILFPQEVEARRAAEAPKTRGNHYNLRNQSIRTVNSPGAECQSVRRVSYHEVIN